jgi:transposase-like protein
MQHPIFKIFEQFDRTRSPVDQTALGPMLGFKNFRRAATTIAGIELIHRIRKGQFKLGKLRIKDKTAPEIWNAVLAA